MHEEGKEEMANERQRGQQKRGRAASSFLCRVQMCKKRRKRGSKACQCAAERRSEGAEERERVMGAGRAGEGGSVRD